MIKIVPVKRNLRKIEDEVWSKIPGYPDSYIVSNYGRVKSFKKDKLNGKILKHSINNGLHVVPISNNGHKKTCMVHKLVAEAFIQKPSEKHVHVIHLDWNMDNNHVSNIQWLTREEIYNRLMNNLRTRDRSHIPPKITYSKLKKKDVAQIKLMLEKGIKQNVIAKLFGISEMQVTRIKRGENWGSVKPAESRKKRVQTNEALI